MQIHDGESPFLTSSMSQKPWREIFTLAKEESAQNQGLNLDAPAGNQTLTKVVIFKIPGYYACTASIPKNGGILRAVLVHPLDTQSRQLFTLRLVFLVSVIAAILALAVFFLVFHTKMIQPLEQSRRQQTQFIAFCLPRAPLSFGSDPLQHPSHAGRPACGSRPLPGHDPIRGGTHEPPCGRYALSGKCRQPVLSIHPAPCELDTLLLEISEKYEPAHALQKAPSRRTP